MDHLKEILTFSFAIEVYHNSRDKQQDNMEKLRERFFELQAGKMLIGEPLSSHEFKKTKEFLDQIKKGQLGSDPTDSLIELAFDLSKNTWEKPKTDSRSAEVFTNPKTILEKNKNLE